MSNSPAPATVTLTPPGPTLGSASSAASMAAAVLASTASTVIAAGDVAVEVDGELTGARCGAGDRHPLHFVDARQERVAGVVQQQAAGAAP